MQSEKFAEVMNAEMCRAQRYSTPLSLLVFDIDKFEKVKDVFGDIMAELVLNETARMLENNIRMNDTLTWRGSEKFMVLVPNTTTENATRLAEKLRSILEQFDFEDNLRVTASFGVTSFEKNDSLESMTHRAYGALGRAQDEGGNRVEVA